MYHFTTYFDINYLSRGLVLYDSLKKHCEQFDLYVLSLDSDTYNYFQSNIEIYPEIAIIKLAEIEEFDLELKECKSNRSTIEYYFTLSPCLPLYILKKYDVNHICSLDADIMFFSTPAKIFSYLDKYSVLITPHNFSPELKKLEVYGEYNVSFQIFKNDSCGISCLENWRKQCIDWCYDKLENEKYADQKYLDKWINDFEGILSIPHPESGVAPWNIGSYSITYYKNQVFINGHELIFYHYQGMRLLGSNFIIHGLGPYSVKSSYVISRFIYKPYISLLLEFNSNNDFGIKRNNYKLVSLWRIVFFQNDWYLFVKGVLFETNSLIELIGKTLMYFKKLRNIWHD